MSSQDDTSKCSPLLKVLQGEGQQVVPGHKKTKLVVQMLNEDATITDRLSFLQEGLPYR